MIDLYNVHWICKIKKPTFFKSWPHLDNAGIHCIVLSKFQEVGRRLDKKIASSRPTMALFIAVKSGFLLLTVWFRDLFKPRRHAIAKIKQQQTEPLLTKVWSINGTSCRILQKWQNGIPRSPDIFFTVDNLADLVLLIGHHGSTWNDCIGWNFASRIG